MAGVGKSGKRRMEPEPVSPLEGEESLETRKKRMKNELEKLDFANAGSKQAVPDLDDFAGRRTLRSGKSYLPLVKEVIGQEDVLTDRQGSLDERALHLATQLKDRIKGSQGFVDDIVDGQEDKRHDSSFQSIIDAVESFEQQSADENSRVRRSVVFLGHNGNGKSFFINLALQVRESLVHYLVNLEGNKYLQPLGNIWV